MLKLQAVNNVLIIKKDVGEKKFSESDYKNTNMMEIPEPYTGYIDSIGDECEYEIGQHVAFADVGGVYVEMDDGVYVVVTPEMIIGIL